jgi:hypothetical protein
MVAFFCQSGKDERKADSSRPCNHRTYCYQRKLASISPFELTLDDLHKKSIRYIDLHPRFARKVLLAA